MPAPATKPALVFELGRRDYGEVWALQRRLVERRQAGHVEDLLLLVEHPDVITLGRRQGSRDNVRAPAAEAAEAIPGGAPEAQAPSRVRFGALELPIFEIERGGDVTYHGPGQLVGYPILKLEEGERDLHAYLRHLEEGMIDLCAELGLPAGRREAYTGVWVGDRKVASIGIAVRRWVTLHGFALNVATELSRFAAINPCGLDAQVMTSLEALLGRPVTLAEVTPRLVPLLGRALGRDFRPADPALLG